METNPAQAPLVSIILLASGKCAYTRRTLARLLESTYGEVELVLVDNGSDDATPDLFARTAGDAAARGWRAETIRFDENTGAVAGRNAAMEKARGAYVVFLDNDVVMGQRGWIERFLAVFARDPEAGIVGPKILFAHLPETIQCAGCTVCRGGRVDFRGRGDRADDPRYAAAEAVPALISACWMMRREVMDALGPLDMRFHPVQFEDIDYCYRARAAGWRVLYTPEIVAYHFENVTTDGTPKLNYRYLTVKNGLAFKRKWAETIAREGGPEDASVLWAEIPHAPLHAVGELPLDD